MQQISSSITPRESNGAPKGKTIGDLRFFRTCLTNIQRSIKERNGAHTLGTAAEAAAEPAVTETVTDSMDYLTPTKVSSDLPDIIRNNSVLLVPKIETAAAAGTSCLESKLIAPKAVVAKVIEATAASFDNILRASSTETKDNVGPVNALNFTAAKSPVTSFEVLAVRSDDRAADSVTSSTSLFALDSRSKLTDPVTPDTSFKSTPKIGLTFGNSKSTGLSAFGKAPALNFAAYVPATASAKQPSGIPVSVTSNASLFGGTKETKKATTSTFSSPAAPSTPSLFASRGSAPSTPLLASHSSLSLNVTPGSAVSVQMSSENYPAITVTTTLHSGIAVSVKEVHSQPPSSGFVAPRSISTTGFVNRTAPSPPTSTKNAMRITKTTSKKAMEYVTELGLEDEVEEDVQQEIETATSAWAGIVSTVRGNMSVDGSLILDASAGGNDCAGDDGIDVDGVLCELVTALGMTYSDEEHGVALREVACVVSESRRELSLGAFTRWYISLLFHDEDEEEYGDEGDVDDDELNDDEDAKDKKAPSATIAGPSVSLPVSSFGIFGSQTSGAGVDKSWKCETCLASNPWEKAQCLCCNATAPHTSSLAVAAAAAASAAPSSSASVSGITSGGFSFGGGGVSSAGAVGVSGGGGGAVSGFSFSGAPALVVAAPVSGSGSGFVFGSGVPVSTGFGFGSTASAAPESSSLPSSGGFRFGVPKAGDAAVSSLAPLSVSSSAPIVSSSAVGGVGVRTASEYVTELGLEDEVEEDVQQEIETATSAWAGIVSTVRGNMSVDGSLILDASAGGNDCAGDDGIDVDGVLCELVTALGMTYSDEEHGVALREVACVVSESRRELSLGAFTRWYISLLFHDEDEEEYGDEGDVDDDELNDDEDAKDKKAPSATIAGPSVSLPVSSFGIFGSQTSGAGVDKSWKCETCLASNPWEKAQCLCCNATAPHTSSLAVAAAASAASAAAAAAAPSSSASVSGITSGGFSFGGGGVSSTGAVGVSGGGGGAVSGFSFSGAPALVVAAPVSGSGSGFVFGSGVPVSTGFGFGSTASAAPESSSLPSSGGFRFGVPKAGDAAVSSSAPLSVSSSAPIVSSSAVGGVGVRTASEYVTELGLEDEVEEDVQQEIETARSAWAGIVSTVRGNMSVDGSLILDASAGGNDCAGDDGIDVDGVLCELVTALGTTYSDEEHGVALREVACVVSESRRELSLGAFTEWYISLLFHDEDEEEYGDEGDVDDDELNDDEDAKDKKAPSATIAGPSVSLPVSSFGIFGSQTSGAGVDKSWKCETCLASNPWEKAQCLCCNATAPHTSSLAAAAAASAASAAPSSSASVSGITSGGFSFGGGGVSSAGAVGVSGGGGGAVSGFSFSGAPALVVAAPVSGSGSGFVFGSGVPVSSGFGFGSTASAAPESSSLPSSGGFTFGVPKAGDAAVSSLAPLSVSSSAPIVSSSAVGGVGVRTASEYVTELGLEDEVEEDVQQEIETARSAWAGIVSTVRGNMSVDGSLILDASAGGNDCAGDDGIDVDGVLCELVTALGTTYSDEEHGVALREVACVVSESRRVLSLGAFTEWYISLLFHDEDEEEYGDEGDVDDDELNDDEDAKDKKAPSATIAGPSVSLPVSSFGIFGSQTSGAGVDKSWKCETCLASNPWEKAQCLCCNATAPHTSSLAAAAAASAASAAPSSSASVSGITSGGFSFGGGGVSSAGAVGVSGGGGGAVSGFSFSGAPALVVAAPVSGSGSGFVFGSGVPVSSGFGFGSTASAAPESSSLPSSGGFRFGVPKAGDAAVSSLAPLSVSSSAPIVSSSAVGGVGVRTASEYVTELGLEDEVEEDVQQEIETARSAWAGIVSTVRGNMSVDGSLILDASAGGNDCAGDDGIDVDGVLCELVTALGMTYSDEEHGVALREVACVVSESRRELSLGAFTEWYISLLFHDEDEEEYGDEGDVDDDELNDDEDAKDKKAPSATIAGPSVSLPVSSFGIFGSQTSGAGVDKSWKCETCLASNPWEKAQCLCCNATAPHTSSLAVAAAAAAAAAASAAAAAAALSSSASVSGITSGGFSFGGGGVSSTGAVGVSGGGGGAVSGFSFSGAPALVVAAPVSGSGFVFGSGVPVSTGFGFGSTASAAPESSSLPSSGGFRFGVPKAGDAAVSSSAPLSVSSSAPIVSSSAVGGVGVRTASEYVTELGLEDEVEEDVQQEIETARSAWAGIVSTVRGNMSVDGSLILDASAGGNDCAGDDGIDVDGVLCELVTALGTTYSDEEHGVALREVACVVSESRRVLSLGAFTRWYISLLFHDEDEEEYGDEGDVDDDELNDDEDAKDKKAPSATIAGPSVSLPVSSFGIFGSQTSGAGVDKSWKCETCLASNPWEKAQCLCCNATAPHTSSLAVAASAAAAAAAAPSSSASVSGITSGGFSFGGGGVSSAGAVGVSGGGGGAVSGFSFSGAPALVVAAPVSGSGSGFVFGSGVPVSTGFGFGSTASAAPESSSLPSSGGFRFGVPKAGDAAVSSSAPLSVSSSAPIVSSSAVGGVGVRTASEYVTELGLEDEVEEDVQQEIETARSAWAGIVSTVRGNMSVDGSLILDASAGGNDCAGDDGIDVDGVLCELVTALGTTYSDEEHGVALREVACVVSESRRELSLGAFTEWYISLLFHDEDEEEYGDEGDVDDDELNDDEDAKDKKAPSAMIAGPSVSLPVSSFGIFGSQTSGAGVDKSWKCETCLASNPWEKAQCLCCNATAPHTSSLAVAAAAAAASAAPSSSASVSGITSGGFSLGGGGVSSAGAVGVSGGGGGAVSGFSFSGAPALVMAAPVSGSGSGFVFGSGVPVSSGFGFGSTASAAPESSSLPSSGGFRFGVPKAGDAAVSSSAPLSVSSSAPIVSSSAVGGVGVRTASEYVTELGLEDEVEEDVQQEIETARSAWAGIVSTVRGNMSVDGSLILDASAGGNDCAGDDGIDVDGVLCELVTALGTTYSDEEHGVALREVACVVSESRRELSLGAFTEWYISLLFHDEDEEEYGDEGDVDDDELNDDEDAKDKKAPSATIAGPSVSLPVSSFGIFGSQTSGAGVDKSWKCETCLASNPWEKAQCLCCNATAPHTSSLAVAAAAAAASAAPSSSASVSGITSGGFSFGGGGVSSAGAVGVSGGGGGAVSGFSFSGAPALVMAAPVSGSGSGFVFGSGVPVSSGFGFGSTASAAPESSSLPSSGGFRFGVPKAGDAAVSSSAPLSVSSSAPIVSSSAVGGVGVRTASEYVTELGLEDEVEEDVQQEIETARSAWAGIVSTVRGNMSVDGSLILDASAGGNDCAGDDGIDVDGVLCELVTALGTTYSDEEHGVALREVACVVSESRRELSLGAFTEWYISLLFHDEDEEEYGDEGDVDDDELNDDEDAKDKKAPSATIAGPSVSLPVSSFGIFGSQTSGAGVDKSWKCETCLASNPWEKAQCLCCNATAPHTSSLAAAAAASAASAAPSSSASVSGITSGGFSFGGGGVSSAGAVGVSGGGGGAVSGFSFSGAPALVVAAPVSGSGSGFVFGSGVPVSTGFGFGSTASAAPESSSLPSSGGFRFGVPKAGDAAVSSLAPLSVSSSAPIVSSSAVGGVGVRTASEYVTELGLEDEVEEDVQQEIETARSAWAGIVSTVRGNMSVDGSLILDASAGGNDCAGDDGIDVDGVLCELVTALGTTYSDEEHGVALREVACVVSESRRELSLGAFTEWYISLLFHDEDEEEYGDEGDVDDDELNDDEDAKDKKAPSATIAGPSVSLPVSSFGIFGSQTSGAGVDKSWKCETCLASNPWEKAQCLCCNATAPHTSSLAVAAAASAASAAPSSSASVSGITSGGFSFGGGGVSSAGAVGVSGGGGGAVSGFSFSGAPALVVAAPVSGSGSGFVFGSGVPVSSGFGFGSTASAAPESSSLPSSGGFTFGVPKAGDVAVSSSAPLSVSSSAPIVSSSAVGSVGENIHQTASGIPENKHHNL